MINIETLGTFVEIEAIDEQEMIGHENLLAQCHQYLAQYRIADEDLVATSYGDLAERTEHG